MYINNSNSFLPSTQQQSLPSSQPMVKGSVQTEEIQLNNFTQKANLSFENLSYGMSEKEKSEVAEALNNIGKAAAFASANGFDSQEEQGVVRQLFGNFSGVISDEEIKKMIYTKLNNPDYENREFLESFAQSLDAPLRSINISV